MKVFEEKFKLRLPKSMGRSEGMHVSEIIRDYAVTTKTLDKKWVSTALIEDQNTNLMQVGLGWEDYLARYQHPEIEFHPGEIFMEDDEFCECGHYRDVHLNGKEDCNCGGCLCERFRPLTVHMSPDGVSCIDPEDYADLFTVSDTFLHEFKFTRKSSRDFKRALQYREKKALMWLWQIAAYCIALNTLAAKLHVMFINGNYSRDDNDPESQPSYKIFRIEWEREDLERTWNLLRNHARTMKCR